MQANRLGSLQDLIRLYPGTIILKGHHTLLGLTLFRESGVPRWQSCNG
ncbi:MAG: hypothetical protein EBR64_04680 [Burkholderiaceae bacterium]|nr:hypothetical protein [Burkholderiaceae bacterium]